MNAVKVYEVIYQESGYVNSDNINMMVRLKNGILSIILSIYVSIHIPDGQEVVIGRIKDWEHGEAYTYAQPVTAETMKALQVHIRQDGYVLVDSMNATAWFYANAAFIVG